LYLLSSLELTYGVADGEVVALGAENGHQSSTGVIQGPGNQQRNEKHGEEDHRLGDEHGQEEAPVHRVPVELHQRQEDQRGQGKGAHEGAQTLGFRIANDLETSGDVTATRSKQKENIKHVIRL